MAMFLAKDCFTHVNDEMLLIVIPRLDTAATQLPANVTRYSGNFQCFSILVFWSVMSSCKS